MQEIQLWQVRQINCRLSTSKCSLWIIWRTLIICIWMKNWIISRVYAKRYTQNWWKLKIYEALELQHLVIQQGRVLVSLASILQVNVIKLNVFLLKRNTSFVHYELNYTIYIMYYSGRYTQEAVFSFCFKKQVLQYRDFSHVHVTVKITLKKALRRGYVHSLLLC